MKKLLFPLFLLLYLSQILMILGHGDGVLLICAIMFFAFVLACVNIIYAILGNKNLRIDNKKQQSANRTILIAKLIAIPFFALNYLTWSLIVGVLLLTPGMLFLFVLIPIIIGYTYSVLLATSSYTISLLFALYKNSVISRKQLIIHVIFQLIFVLDVIDQIIIFKLTKKAGHIA